MDDFSFDNFDGSFEEVNSSTTSGWEKHETGPVTFSQDLTDELALAVMDSAPPPISYLYEYKDHEGEDYSDATSRVFIAWYADPENQKLSRTFVACALEERHQRRLNNTCALQLPKYVDQFNEQGMRKVDTDYECESIIPQHAGPRLSRIYNVWYRKNNSADGARLFATNKFPTRQICCPACQTIFIREKIIKYGQIWLNLTRRLRGD